MGLKEKDEPIKRELFGFIIKSALLDKLVTSTDLYLTRDIALEEAEHFNKIHFTNMTGNFYLTKKYIVHIKRENKTHHFSHE